MFDITAVLRRYVGYALTTVWDGSEAGDQQVIGFDMGGTSTDVSRYAGSYEHVFESTTAGGDVRLLHNRPSGILDLRKWRHSHGRLPLRRQLRTCVQVRYSR